MYLEHFGLNAPPFQFTASPTALYMSRTHRDCLAALEWGLLHEPSGLTMLIGDTGVGKTTLVCALLARQYREVRAAYLGNPRLSFEELLSSILSQLGVRGGRGNKAAMINALTHFAAGLPATELIAILVDEAQALSDGALEDFRLLSNLDRAGGRKAAQMVLAGQFELARRLAAAPMRQLNERIGARAVLEALTQLESREYIEHRLRLCGGSSGRLFARRALDHIVRHSAGVPRRINAFCHNALLLAYSSGAKQVGLPMARAAVADYDAIGEVANQNGGSSGWLPQGARSMGPVLGLGLLGVAGFITGQAVLQHHPVCHLRSMVAHTAPATTAAPASSVAAPAAAIDPGIIVGSTSIEHEEPQPPSEGVSLAAPQPPSEGVSPAAPQPPSEGVSPAAPQPPSEGVSPAAPQPPSEGVSLAAPQPPAGVASLSAPGMAPASAVKTYAPVAAASEPQPQPRFVIVTRGDTLGDIALRYTGSAQVDGLLRLNRKIADAGSLYPGEKIYLPPQSQPDENATDVE